MNDIFQAAIANCLAQGYRLSERNPFSDGRVHKTAQRLKIDESRRVCREAKRIGRWASESHILERIDPRRRYVSGRDDPSEIISNQELLSLLRQFVAKLRPKYREIILNCDLGGRPVAEFARECGRTPTAVRNDRYRAYLELRVELNRSRKCSLRQ